MGEYAKHNGAQVKIGTCEDMYYLRADQRFQVTPESGSVNPDTPGLRYRFPWPDEDGIAPGGGFHDKDYERSVWIPGATMPEGVDHYSVQFRATAGYLVSLPCPEGPDALEHLTVHRNGFAGAVHLVRQKLLEDGRLVPVLKCGGCGALWRVEDRAGIEELATLLRSVGDRRGGTFWHTIADRMLAGAEIQSDALR